MKILITGATGQQGGAVVRALEGHGHAVRAMTRDPGKADDLRHLGVDVVKGDFEHPDTVREAAEGMDVAWLMSTPYEDGPEEETKQAKAAMNALRDADVGHIVYASVASADKGTEIPFFDSKFAAEQHLAGLGVPYTIVAPVWFRENLLDPAFTPGLDEGKLMLALPEERPLQNIGLEEIGRFNAHIIENHRDHQNMRIDIASDATVPVEMAWHIGKASGADVRSEEIPLDKLREQNPPFAAMFSWFQDEGYDVDIEALRSGYPNVGWKDFGQWAQDQDWQIVQTMQT